MNKININKILIFFIFSTNVLFAMDALDFEWNNAIKSADQKTLKLLENIQKEDSEYDNAYRNFKLEKYINLFYEKQSPEDRSLQYKNLSYFVNLNFVRTQAYQEAFLKTINNDLITFYLNDIKEIAKMDKWSTLANVKNIIIRGSLYNNFKKKFHLRNRDSAYATFDNLLKDTISEYEENKKKNIKIINDIVFRTIFLSYADDDQQFIKIIIDKNLIPPLIARNLILYSSHGNLCCQNEKKNIYEYVEQNKNNSNLPLENNFDLEQKINIFYIKKDLKTVKDNSTQTDLSYSDYDALQQAYKELELKLKSIRQNVLDAIKE